MTLEVLVVTPGIRIVLLGMLETLEIISFLSVKHQQYWNE